MMFFACSADVWSALTKRVLILGTYVSSVRTRRHATIIGRTALEIIGSVTRINFFTPSFVRFVTSSILSPIATNRLTPTGGVT